jgi:hypothetical protein
MLQAKSRIAIKTLLTVALFAVSPPSSELGVLHLL